MSTILAPQPTMSAPLAATPIAGAASSTASSLPVSAPAAKPLKTWLVSPWFDLLFIGNLSWPVIVLLTLVRSMNDQDPLNLFVIYFLSTPHRWITLVLVFCDSDRFRKEPLKFGGMAVGLVGAGLLLVGIGSLMPHATDSLILLMMLDYIWNAWHFAAQHAGIARIYGRMTRQEQSLPQVEFEKTAIRVLVLWVFFRLAIHIGSQTPYGDNVRWLTPWLQWIDPLVLVPAVILLAREIGCFRAQCLGRLCYIGSVLGLYAAQLLAIRLGSEVWMRAFFLAGAVFHAVEYLAICNWSVQKKTSGIWQYQLTRTSMAVLVFMGILGVTNWFIAMHSQYLWAFITLLVSLLHYAYDGIIWRARPAPVKMSPHPATI